MGYVEGCGQRHCVRRRQVTVAIKEPSHLGQQCDSRDNLGRGRMLAGLFPTLFVASALPHARPSIPRYDVDFIVRTEAAPPPTRTTLTSQRESRGHRPSRLSTDTQHTHIPKVLSNLDCLPTLATGLHPAPNHIDAPLQVKLHRCFARIPISRRRAIVPQKLWTMPVKV